ncbi:hypothetical protein L1987_23372 [Smallanthus sonchifolius]|uniref:Uncharacterized protein n=1 Tax=Smallanthus sonchifolius TaxID=185202 RepID=A0ACB9IGR7_9ASTR|nr:hypothetical protein L1987_23372 [Smallanthus sonchifolius]
MEKTPLKSKVGGHVAKPSNENDHCRDKFFASDGFGARVRTKVHVGLVSTNAGFEDESSFKRGRLEKEVQRCVVTTKEREMETTSMEVQGGNGYCGVTVMAGVAVGGVVVRGRWGSDEESEGGCGGTTAMVHGGNVEPWWCMAYYGCG